MGWVFIRSPSHSWDTQYMDIVLVSGLSFSLLYHDSSVLMKHGKQNLSFCMNTLQADKSCGQKVASRLTVKPTMWRWKQLETGNVSSCNAEGLIQENVRVGAVNCTAFYYNNVVFCTELWMSCVLLRWCWKLNKFKVVLVCSSIVIIFYVSLFSSHVGYLFTLVLEVNTFKSIIPLSF